MLKLNKCLIANIFFFKLVVHVFVIEEVFCSIDNNSITK